MKTIKCNHCGEEIELTEALTKDLEKTILATEHAKHVSELERVKKEASEAAAKLDLKLQNLQKEAGEASEDNKELRKQLATLMQELRESKKARANVELEMQKKLGEEEAKIREEATKQADEKQRLNLAAKENTISLYKSQARPAPSVRSQEIIRALARLRGSQCGASYAEGFTAYRKAGK